MITLITGAPGAGKTAALVSMLADLGKDRQLWVHGIPELKIKHETLIEPAEWTTTVPDGSVVVIDEVQNVWRPRSSGSKVPDHVSALETHRHKGLDFYIITQGPNLLDTNVRALCGRHVHLRDVGFLGRWWYEWPECADQCRTTWKNAPLKKKYALPKKIFGEYKSASLHVKPIRSFPKMAIVLVVALLAVVFMSWKIYSLIENKVAPAAAPVAQPKNVLPGNPAVGTALTQISGLVDERIHFVPRLTDRPWTAPAYDSLRVVVAMPIITSAICVNDSCQCFHQSSLIEVSSTVCKDWAVRRPFSPYVPDDKTVASNARSFESLPADSKPISPRSAF